MSKWQIFRLGWTLVLVVSYKRGGDSMEKKRVVIPVAPPAIHTGAWPIVTDPYGSYTGLVHDLSEKPVQDADDL